MNSFTVGSFVYLLSKPMNSAVVEIAVAPSSVTRKVSADGQESERQFYPVKLTGVSNGAKIMRAAFAETASGAELSVKVNGKMFDRLMAAMSGAESLTFSWEEKEKGFVTITSNTGNIMKLPITGDDIPEVAMSKDGGIITVVMKAGDVSEALRRFKAVNGTANAVPFCVSGKDVTFFGAREGGAMSGRFACKVSTVKAIGEKANHVKDGEAVKAFTSALTASAVSLLESFDSEEKVQLEMSDKSVTIKTVNTVYVGPAAVTNQRPEPYEKIFSSFKESASAPGTLGVFVETQALANACSMAATSAEVMKVAGIGDKSPLLLSLADEGKTLMLSLADGSRFPVTIANRKGEQTGGEVGFFTTELLAKMASAVGAAYARIDVIRGRGVTLYFTGRGEEPVYGFEAALMSQIPASGKAAFEKAS